MEKGALHRDNRENQEKGQKIREKEKIFPNFQTVFQQESVGPSVRGAGGPKQQIIDLEMLVAATRSKMETGHLIEVLALMLRMQHLQWTWRGSHLS